jgi:hypothetical protein
MNKTEFMSGRKRWLIVFGFAVAMAWVEAAAVLYLRTIVDRIEPWQPNPFPIIGNMGWVELAREAATLVMLLAVGILAGRAWRSRLGFAAIAFGVWDIFYYVFLKAMCGWPHSVMDWDILFLIPLPWWGPVLAPVLISLLLIVWGTLACRLEQTRIPVLPELAASGLGAVGVLLGLRVFMADALAAAPRGGDAIRNVLPGRFHWPLFCAALLLMAAPAMQLLWSCLHGVCHIGSRADSGSGDFERPAATPKPETSAGIKTPEN